MKTIQHCRFAPAQKEDIESTVNTGETPECKTISLPFTLSQRPGSSTNETHDLDPVTFVLYPATTLSTKVIRLFYASPQIA